MVFDAVASFGPKGNCWNDKSKSLNRLENRGWSLLLHKNIVWCKKTSEKKHLMISPFFWLDCHITSYITTRAKTGIILMFVCLFLHCQQYFCHVGSQLTYSHCFWAGLDLLSSLPVPNEPWHDQTSKVTVGPAKTRISLGFRPVWSESSLSAWRKLGSLATY